MRTKIDTLYEAIFGNSSKNNDDFKVNKNKFKSIFYDNLEFFYNQAKKEFKEIEIKKRTKFKIDLKKTYGSSAFKKVFDNLNLEGEKLDALIESLTLSDSAISNFINKEKTNIRTHDFFSVFLGFKGFKDFEKEIESDLNFNKAIRRKKNYEKKSKIHDDIDFKFDSQNYFIFKNAQGHVLIKYEDIFFIKSDKNYCFLFDYFKMNNNSMTNYYSDYVILISKTLKIIENSLPNNFIRVHKSFIINKSYIKELKIGRKLIIIQNANCKIEIPIGRTYLDKVRNLISI